jgi:hypothetical protein
MTGPESKYPGASANASGAGVQLPSETITDTTARKGAPPQLPTRGEAIALKCRDCVHDDAAAGTWRQQVTACHLTACPLWRFRPLAGGVPAWISARDPKRLPPDWHTLPHEAAIGILSGKVAASPDGCAVEAIRKRPPVQTRAPCPAAA